MIYKASLASEILICPLLSNTPRMNGLLVLGKFKIAAWSKREMKPSWKKSRPVTHLSQNKALVSERRWYMWCLVSLNDHFLDKRWDNVSVNINDVIESSFPSLANLMGMISVRLPQLLMWGVSHCSQFNLHFKKEWLLKSHTHFAWIMKIDTSNVKIP